jgi:hypothetical protein
MTLTVIIAVAGMWFALHVQPEFVRKYLRPVLDASMLGE